MSDIPSGNEALPPSLQNEEMWTDGDSGVVGPRGAVTFTFIQ